MPTWKIVVFAVLVGLTDIIFYSLHISDLKLLGALCVWYAIMLCSDREWPRAAGIAAVVMALQTIGLIALASAAKEGLWNVELMDYAIILSFGLAPFLAGGAVGSAFRRPLRRVAGSWLANLLAKGAPWQWGGL
jgi:hypothetical protein